MNKLLISLVGALLLVGGGCNKQAPQQNTVADQEVVVAYSNTLGGYSFSYPKSVQLGASSSAVSESVEVYNVPTGTALPDNAFPVFAVKVIKSTVYPESKIEVLKKEFFKNRTTKVAAFKVNNISGWEIAQVEPTDDYNPYARMLYFPNGSNELLVIDFNNDETTTQIINSLKSAK